MIINQYDTFVFHRMLLLFNDINCNWLLQDIKRSESEYNYKNLDYLNKL